MDTNAIVPRRGPDRPVNPWVEYDEVEDALTLYFFGSPEAAVSYKVPNDRHLYLRLSENDYEIIGVHIEAFATGYLAVHPELIDLAREAGVPEKAIEQVLQGLDVAQVVDQRRRGFARLLMAEIEDRDLAVAD
jgi:AraC-like DNA-binding protein